MNIIRYITMAGIFILPVTVLIVAESLFFPFITGKNFFFRILVEIIFGLWLILVIYDKIYLPQKSWILYFLSAFLLVLILSTIFGANPYRSFWSNYERMEGLVTFLHLFAYFLILASVLNPPAGGEKLWKIFFHISLAISIIVSLYGLLQMAGKFEIHQGSTRLDATLGNASYLAVYMVFHIFIALWYFFKEKNWYKWFYIPVIVLETIILYNTATRGTVLGFIGGLFITFFIIGIFSESKKARISAAGVLALILVLIGSFWLFKSSDFVKNSPVLSRFSGISLEETTTQSRFVIWKMSWEGFKEKPILGWGPENYNLVFNKYYEPILYKQEPWFDRAHNVFFDRLTTNGIFGLLAYLGLFGASLYCLLLKRKKYGFSSYDSGILTGLFSAYFFHNIFVFDNLISLILFFSFLAYMHHRTVELGHLVSKQPEQDDYKKPAFSAIAAIAVIFIIYFINVPGLLAANNILSAFKESGAGNSQGAFDRFEKALSYNSFGSLETREHFVNFALQSVSQPNLDDDFKAKVFNAASAEMKKQIEQSPEDIRYMIFLGALYNKGKQYNQAIEILQKAIELSPKKQQLYFELGSSYLNTKEYKKAVEVLKTAFDLEPTFDDARKIYATALIFDSQEEAASELLKEKYGTDIIADERLLRAYSERKNLLMVVAIWEKFVENNPGNAQYHVSLAANYLQIGERQKAIEQLEKAIELEPKFKQQGEYYINEIKAGRNP